MALFKIEKGLAEKLTQNRPNTVEGYCYVTTDDGKFYIDTETGTGTSKRIVLNAGKADKLSAARKIKLTGDASGSVEFDGSKDVTITVDIPRLDTTDDAVGALPKTASKGIQIVDRDIQHTNNVTAGTVSEGGSARTLGFGGSFNIPSVTYDAQGHIKSTSSIALKLPANPNTDTKVTSVGNHYTPTADSTSQLSVNAASGSAASWGSTNFITGVNLQRDAKGHVVGVTVDSAKMPSNPNTDTGATSIVVDGDGNAITAASYDSTSRTITLTKGATYNNYSLPNATTSTKGGVKIGNNITVSSGTISLTKDNVTAALGYTPLSTDTDTGATGITIAGTGNAVTEASYDPTTKTITLTKGATYNNYTLPAATTSALGGVKVGSNISLSSGTISLTKANVVAALGYTPPTTNTTYNIVTASANGLVPMFDAADGTIDSSSTDWVLTNNNGNIGWYKLPANAFKNDDTNTAHTHSAGVGLTGSGTAGTSGTYNYKVNLVDETVSTNASTYATGGTSKFYAVQLDKDNKLAVAVPWTDTNTTYSAGTGLSLSGTTFNHSNSVTAKGAYEQTTTTVAPGYGKTFKVYEPKYDAQGHITGVQAITVTMPSAQTIPTTLKNPYALTIGDTVYDGSSAKTVTAKDLGLTGAMRFIGTSSVAITDGGTQAPTIGGSSITVANLQSGNVVLYGNQEFVWNGSNWELLGDEGSYKVKQTAVSDPTASGTSTTFIATISQNTNGVISATKKTINVGNGTITIKQAGVSKGTFTMNQSGNTTIELTDTDTNTHYTTGITAGATGTTSNSATTNGNTYIKIKDDSTHRGQIKITGSGATTVTSDANGVITISSTDSNTNTAHAHTAGTGLSISGSGGTSGTTTYSLATVSGLTAGSYGPSAAVTGNNNATMNVPQITVDAYGRVTSVTNRVYTAKNTTYSVMTGATASTAGTAGLVLAPAAGQQNAVLKGNATWATVNSKNINAVNTMFSAKVDGEKLILTAGSTTSTAVVTSIS